MFSQNRVYHGLTPPGGRGNFIITLIASLYCVFKQHFSPISTFLSHPEDKGFVCHCEPSGFPSTFCKGNKIGVRGRRAKIFTEFQIHLCPELCRWLWESARQMGTSQVEVRRRWKRYASNFPSVCSQVYFSNES